MSGRVGAAASGPERSGGKTPAGAPARERTEDTVSGSDGLPQPMSAVPWDLGHLRSGLLTTGVLAVVGIPLAWLGRDARAAAWVAVGLAIVAAFFCLGALAVAAAGRIGEELTLPAALGTYLIKVVLLGVLLVSVQGKPWLDPTALGLSVLVGTLAWTVVHARRVWTSRIYYVDPPVR